MSKIPLANEGSDRGNSKSRKDFWIQFLIGSLIVIAVAIITAIAVYVNLTSWENRESQPKFVFHILADAFSISGLVGLLFYLMTFVSSQGAFDMLSYSVQLVFLITFRRKYREENFPKNYYEYKVMKDHEERKAYAGLLWPSLIFLVIGIILLIIYMNI